MVQIQQADSLSYIN